MFSNKRNGETFFHDNKDDEEFQIKKKNRLMSMDTSDTSPLRESIFGLTPQKDSSMNSINSFEHSKLDTCTEFSFSSPMDHGKKNHFPSAYLHSNSEVLKKYLKELTSYEDKFTVIKYNNHKYRLHTAFLVKNEMNNIHICKLIRIIRPTKVNSNKILAFLEVEWYYQKGNLPKKFSSILSHLSENELFLSNQKDFIMVDSILGPCNILSFEEYDNLKATPPNIFFSRATYDIVRRKIEPPIDQWKKHCLCKSPMNPDLLYVQCDKCDGWYHIECIGISREEVEAIEQYFCSSCKSPPKPVAKELNVQIQKKKSQKQNQSSSQSILNYFKRSRDNSSNASPIRINSNILDNESFKNEIQSSIFSQSTATNSTHKAENTSLSHIFDNISQGTHKTPTKDFESFISQEDKTSMRIESQFPQEENEISEKKLDLGPKSDLNMELQDDWIKEINNVSTGNIFNEGFIEKSDEMQEIHVALDL